VILKWEKNSSIPRKKEREREEGESIGNTKRNKFITLRDDVALCMYVTIE